VNFKHGKYNMENITQKLKKFSDFLIINLIETWSISTTQTLHKHTP
jgi:hypothetical protein